MVVQISRANSLFSTVDQEPLEEAINDIRSGRYRGLVLHARTAPTPELRKHAKASLPIMCSGLFAPTPSAGHKTNRTNDNFIEAQCIILDIDHIVDDDEAGLPEPESIRLLKAAFADEFTDSWCAPRIYAAWRSPSGTGLKILFLLDEPVRSADAYKAVAIYVADKFHNEFGLRPDDACKDAARATYLSFDDRLYLNENAKPIEYSLMKDELACESDISEAVSVELVDGSQIEIFLSIAEKIRVFHYKTFRDLCSAVSRLGRETLTMFYERLYASCAADLSENTRRALARKEQYINSFMQPHNRVPLQYVIDYAAKQGYDFTRHAQKSRSSEPMFNITEQKKAAIAWMNERFALFGEGAGVLVMPRRRYSAIEMLREKTVIATDECVPKVRKRDEVRAFLENRVLRVLKANGKWERIPYFELWKAAPNRRDITTLICDPRLPSGPVKDRGVFNIWTGWNINPARLDRVLKYEKASGELVCRPILDFIGDILANGYDEAYEFILNWCAELIQNAGAYNKAAASLVLVSEEEGTGKGTFDEFLRDIIGPIHSAMVQDADLVVGHFNDIVEGKLLITLDEAVYSRDKKAWSKLKNLTGGAYITIHKKFMAPYQIANIARVLILSNNRHVVDIGQYNRRYYVSEVSGRVRNNISYFAALRECWTNGGKESFHNLISTRPYDREMLLVTNKTITPIMKENIIGSMDAFDQWLSRLIRFRTVTAGETIVRLNATEETEIPYPILYQDFVDFCRTISDSYSRSEGQFRVRVERCRAFKNIGIKNSGAGYQLVIAVLPTNDLIDMFPVHSYGAEKVGEVPF